GLHLLNLAELFFERPPVRDVLPRPGNPVQLVILVQHWEGAVEDPTHRAVRADDSVCLLARFTDAFPKVLINSRPVIGMHHVEKVGALLNILRAAAPDPFESWAYVQDAISIDIQHPEDLVDAVSHLPEPLVAFS